MTQSHRAPVGEMFILVDGTNEALVSRKDTQYEEDHDTVSQSTSWGDVYLLMELMRH